MARSAPDLKRYAGLGSGSPGGAYQRMDYPTRQPLQPARAAVDPTSEWPKSCGSPAKAVGRFSHRVGQGFALCSPGRRLVDRPESRRMGGREVRSGRASLDGLACAEATWLQPANPAPCQQTPRIGGRTNHVQKKLELTVATLKAEHPADEVEAWCEDEARFGLKPILRRVWSPKGERPPAQVDERYEWLWLYAATHPRTGRTFWLVLPHLDSACVQLFLGEFAKEHVIEGKRIVLVWDGAPAHRATSLQIPERITLISLPAYTPELNPGERVWPLVKEGVANRAHDTLDELEQQVCARCQKISVEEVAALTSYHWWPK